MRGKAKVLIAFIIGAIVGGGISTVRLALQTRQVMAQFASIQLTEMVIDARQLSLGQSEEVLRRKNTAIPSIVAQFDQIHRKFLPEKQKNNALWAVQRYYEDASLEIPIDIKSILDDLPPRPLTSCELGDKGSAPNDLKKTETEAEQGAAANADKRRR